MEGMVAIHGTQADAIRSFAGENFVSKARQHGDSKFTIVSGEVHRGMGLRDRMPNVCSALGSREFLEANRLVLISREGPPSGKSSTVRFTYSFREGTKGDEMKEDVESQGWDTFLALRGAARDVFAEYGGGEAFLKQERAAFVSSADPIGSEIGRKAQGAGE